MNRKPQTANRLKLGIAAAFMVFGSATFEAQQVVTLQEAITQALQNKAEAKKAALEIKKAEFKINEATITQSYKSLCLFLVVKE